MSSSTSIFCHNPLMEEWPMMDVQKMLWDMLLQTTNHVTCAGTTTSESEKTPNEPQHENTEGKPLSEPIPETLPPATDSQVSTSEEDRKQQQQQQSGDLVVMMPEGIVTIRPYRISAKATRKRLQTKKHELDDAFEPRPSRLAQRAFDRCLTSDDDIWVERFYFNKAKQRVYFYRSFKTGKCVLSEPPSGAHCIVYIRDLDRAPRHIQHFALERLDKEIYLNCMEKSRPTLPTPTILRAKPPIQKAPMKRRLSKPPSRFALTNGKVGQ